MPESVGGESAGNSRHYPAEAFATKSPLDLDVNRRFEATYAHRQPDHRQLPAHVFAAAAALRRRRNSPGRDTREACAPGAAAHFSADVMQRALACSAPDEVPIGIRGPRRGAYRSRIDRAGQVGRASGQWSTIRRASASQSQEALAGNAADAHRHCSRRSSGRQRLNARGFAHPQGAHTSLGRDRPDLPRFRFPTQHHHEEQ